jgi:hypothetical protein
MVNHLRRWQPAEKERPVREFTKAQKARHAIREFKTLTDALAIRGFYRPSGKMGKALEQCLRNLSPEIYGSMNDPRIVELKGLEYVIDRSAQRHRRVQSHYPHRRGPV